MCYNGTKKYETAQESRTLIPISIPHRNQANSEYEAPESPCRFRYFLVKLRQRGYKRSLTRLYRFLRKQGLVAVKLPNPTYAPKPYEQVQYPGQRIQVDVKFVPAVCLVNQAKRQKFYQYTAIDKCPRWRFLEAFEKHSTWPSLQFLEHLIRAFPMPIECNGIITGSLCIL